MKKPKLYVHPKFIEVIISKQFAFEIIKKAIIKHMVFEIKYKNESVIFSTAIYNKELLDGIMLRCPNCYTELISDKLSEKYGNYCPNLKCNFLK